MAAEGSINDIIYVMIPTVLGEIGSRVYGIKVRNVFITIKPQSIRRFDVAISIWKS